MQGRLARTQHSSTVDPGLNATGPHPAHPSLFRIFHRQVLISSSISMPRRAGRTVYTAPQRTNPTRLLESRHSRSSQPTQRRASCRRRHLSTTRARCDERAVCSTCGMCSTHHALAEVGRGRQPGPVVWLLQEDSRRAAGSGLMHMFMHVYTGSGLMHMFIHVHTGSGLMHMFIHVYTGSGLMHIFIHVHTGSGLMHMFIHVYTGSGLMHMFIHVYTGSRSPASPLPHRPHIHAHMHGCMKQTCIHARVNVRAHACTCFHEQVQLVYSHLGDSPLVDGGLPSNVANLMLENCIGKIRSGLCGSS